MQNKRNYLDVISKHLEVHATVSGTEVCGETQLSLDVVCHSLLVWLCLTEGTRGES